MSKNLIIPDVHGRKFWRKALELVDSVDRVIFLGDYTDPYPNELISSEESIKELEDIIDFKIKYFDKTILLLGNHDCHYYFTDLEPSSRYDRSNSVRINEIFTKNKTLFKILYQYNDILYSHAGVVKEWLDKYCEGRSTDELLNKPIDYFHDKLWVVSYSRGGWEKFGSCVWSDVREFSNDLEYYQVFGHTQMKEELICKTFSCLDSRKCFLIDNDTNEMASVK